MLSQNGHTGQQAHAITSDRVLNLAALRVYQSTPLAVRQADRAGTWRRAVEIARTLIEKAGAA